jgi:glycolate oxidase FAD binding subunit
MSERTCYIEDFGPLPVLNPTNVGDLCEIVRDAASKETAIYPLGGSTRLHYGYPPTKAGTGVGLRALNRVIDYPARDLTVTVEAGITVAALRKVLSAEKQRIPIDVPLDQQATLGGAIATNTSGPRRYGFGTLRDYVIGICVVNDEGQETKAGGRVVKNVAGYDLCKLYVGSLGTLGIVTQVTLKLKPEPEEKAIVLAGCESEELESVLRLLHDTRTRPAAIDLFNPNAAAYINQQNRVVAESRWLIVIAFEDNSRAVKWQTEQLLRELSTQKCEVHGAVQEDTTDRLWRVMTEFQACSDAQLTVKANLLPRAMANLCQRVDLLSERPLLQAHAGNGILFCHFIGGLTLNRAQAVVKELQDAAGSAQGNIVIPRCPPAWKRGLPIWGIRRNDVWLMRRVKEKLDPRRIFNPGRFLDGI